MTNGETVNTDISQMEADSSEFERLCDLGRRAAANLDNGRYLIGDLALEVQKAYRRDSIGRFAKEIGVPKARVQEYRQVCKFWDKNQRAQIFDTYHGMVSYTHLRVAMRLKNNLQAWLFIEECGANGYTCEQAALKMTERLGKPVPAEKLFNGLGLVISIRGDVVAFRVDSAITDALYDAMRKRTPVDINVTVSDEEPDFKPSPVNALGNGYSRRLVTREEMTA